MRTNRLFKFAMLFLFCLTFGLGMFLTFDFLGTKNNDIKITNAAIHQKTYKAAVYFSLNGSDTYYLGKFDKNGYSGSLGTVSSSISYTGSNWSGKSDWYCDGGGDKSGSEISEIWGKRDGTIYINGTYTTYFSWEFKYTPPEGFECSDWGGRTDFPDSKSVSASGWTTGEKSLSSSDSVSISRGTSTYDTYYYSINVRPIAYNVTYYNTYNSANYATKSIRYYNNYTLPSTPTRAGYTFLGWYTSPNGGGTQITSSSVKTSTGNQTLYSHWMQNNYRVDVNILNPYGVQDYKSATMTYYNSNSGVTYYGQTDQPEDNLYYYGRIRISDISPVTGMYVSSVKSTKNKGAITKSENTYIYTLTYGGSLDGGWDDEIIIQLAFSTYLMTFEVNGGSSVTDFYYNIDSTNTLPSTTRTGYTFNKWYVTSGSGSWSYGTTYASGTSVNGKYGSPTLTAQWSANSYPIELNRGEGAGGKSGTTVYYDSQIPSSIRDDTTPNKPLPTRIGYTFGGYYDRTEGSGTQYYDSNGYRVYNNTWKNTEGITLYAKWQNNTYYVQYNANASGTGADGNCQAGDPVSGTMSKSTHYYNKSSNLADNGFKRAGYTFLGWSTDPNAKTANYGNKASISTLTSTNGATVNLYAIWRRDTHTISFNANGGAGTTAPLSMLYNSGDYNLTKCGFTKPGYVFEGWTIKADGAGTVYSDGASVNSKDYVSNTTLYAKWKSTWTTEVPTNHTLSGAGTSTNPYKVSSAIDLAYIAKQVQNGNTFFKTEENRQICFEQTAPINLTGKIWMPIGGSSLGSEKTSFGGYYEGKGFAIIGLETYNQTDTSGKQLYSSVGLFGRTSGAYLRNINLVNAKIYGKTNVGALVGENYDKNLIIYGCFVRGIVTGSENVGGLVGSDVVSGAQILNSGYAGSVTGGSIIAGSIVGGVIKNCYAEVTTNVSFCGSASGASITACVYTAGGSKGYYDDTATGTEYFKDWAVYNGKPLPKGLTWIGGVSGDNVTKVTLQWLKDNWK